MKAVKSISLAALVMALASPFSAVWAEASADAAANCEAEAKDAGIQNAEERAAFVKECVDQANSQAGGEK